jgi:hypothetical protein
MKTPEKLFIEIDNIELTKQEVIERLREFQKEAWNEAIEDAATNAKTKNKRVIATNGYGFNIEEVDKDSILILKK